MSAAVHQVKRILTMIPPRGACKSKDGHLGRVEKKIVKRVACNPFLLLNIQQFLFHVGTANSFVFSLWLFRLVRWYWTFLESLLSGTMFLTFKPLKRTFLLLCLIAEAGWFTSRSLQMWQFHWFIMMFWGSCNSFIFSRMSSKHVISQPYIDQNFLNA